MVVRSNLSPHSQFIFFSQAQKALRMSRIGCALGTDAYTKSTSMVTSARLSSRALLMQLPWELLIAVDAIRAKFLRSGSDTEAVLVPFGRSGAVVARQRGNRLVFVMFPNTAGSIDTMYRKVVTQFSDGK